MAKGTPSRAGLRPLVDLFQEGAVGGLTDSQLLDRFTRQGGASEAAFSALVERHGPMVMQVCRAVLHDVHEGEDAFQAAFLVLARRAGSIRHPELLANWLYGVAHRTARKARRQALRRGGRAAAEGNIRVLDASGRGESHEDLLHHREQVALVHEELERLPDRERAALVLCGLEELTIDDAAQRLRCTPGAVRGRVAQARKRLRTRLARRGVAVPSALVAAVSSTQSSAAAVSPALGAATTRAALGVAPGAASAGVVQVASSVSRLMLLSGLRLPAAALLVLTALGAGVAGWARGGAQGERADARAVPVAPGERPADDRTLVEDLEWYVVNVDPEQRTVSLTDQSGPPQPGPSVSIVNAEGVLAPSGITLRGVPVAAGARVMIDGKPVGLEAVRPGMRVAVALAPGRFALSDIRPAPSPSAGARVWTLDSVEPVERTISASTTGNALRLGRLRAADGIEVSRIDIVPDGPISVHDLKFEDLRPGMPISLVLEMGKDGRLAVRSLMAARGKPREERGR